MEAQARDFFNQVNERLVAIYEPDEASMVTRLLLEELMGLRQLDLALNNLVHIKNKSEIEAAIDRLLLHEPIQHILGFAWFMDRKFEVSPDVLVPRQETEELVHLILHENPGVSFKVLDIGTGSGIIPISIKLAWPDADVMGLDVSSAALAIAQRNATTLNATIRWMEMDILKECPDESFDIIVSNPPYIMDSEKQGMSPNVLNFDPELALFVPNDDPLLFYRKIASYAADHLTAGGKLYFEINELFGRQTAELVRTYGFDSVMLHQDLNGKDRMISAQRKA